MKHTLIGLAIATLVTWPTTLSEAAATTSDAAHYITTKHTPTPAEARDYVTRRASRAGLGVRDIRCLMLLLHKESRFQVEADSPTSSAYGLFQQLHLKPGTPMRDQVTQGLKYLEARYGSACDAWEHSKNLGWY